MNPFRFMWAPNRPGAGGGRGFAEASAQPAFVIEPADRRASYAAALRKVEKAMDLPAEAGDEPEPRGPAPQFSPHGGPQGHRARLRDKLIDRGPAALADYEALEMILFFAQEKGDTKPLAKRLINRFGSFGGVMAASSEDLLGFPQVGRVTLAAIRLVRAAALLMAQAEATQATVLSDGKKLTDYLAIAMAHEKREHFRVLFLDTRNRLIADEVLGRGSVNHVPVYPREVIKRGLELHATAMILVHNHPSGDPEPSEDDVAMTAELCRVGESMSIKIHDHLIVARGKVLSFRSEGLL